MSICGTPCYSAARRLSDKDVKNMSSHQLLKNYVVLEVTFKFPNSVKYPCIPVRVDDHSDIYPLNGESIITGSEYLVASRLGCNLVVKEGSIIPFVRDPSNSLNSISYETPFRGIMKGLQEKRREHLRSRFTT